MRCFKDLLLLLRSTLSSPTALQLLPHHLILSPEGGRRATSSPGTANAGEGDSAGARATAATPLCVSFPSSLTHSRTPSPCLSVSPSEPKPKPRPIGSAASRTTMGISLSSSVELSLTHKAKDEKSFIAKGRSAEDVALGGI